MKNFWIVLLLSTGSVHAEEIFANEFEMLVATRVNAFELKDPHVFVNFSGLCLDATNGVFGQPGFNQQINTAINTDDDGDGNLDLNLLTQYLTDQHIYLVAKPLVAKVVPATCADPLFSAPCLIEHGQNQTLLNTQVDETNACLTTEPNTTSAYVPAVEDTTAPCLSSDPTSITLDVSGIALTLEDYQQALRYQGGLTTDQGLHKGFVSKSVAENIILPASIPYIGGQTLASLLPGGLGNCAATDDRDTHPTIGEGWWFYFNSSSDLIELQ